MKGDQKIIIGVILGTIVLFGLILWFTSSNQTLPQIEQSQVTSEARHIKGANTENALLTIVEFSDFQCPACKAAEPLITQFVENNVEEVRLIYRHFPLVSIHANARTAAIASEIAAEQGKFWEYHDQLFDNQEEWSDASDPKSFFITYAKNVELDEAAFTTALNDASNAGSIYASRVDADRAKADELNLNSTPSFYINGELLAGVPSEKMLNDLLEKARKK